VGRDGLLTHDGVITGVTTEKLGLLTCGVLGLEDGGEERKDEGTETEDP
jgi:hypothetical protein